MLSRRAVGVRCVQAAEQVSLPSLSIFPSLQFLRSARCDPLSEFHPKITVRVEMEAIRCFGGCVEYLSK